MAMQPLRMRGISTAWLSKRLPYSVHQLPMETHSVAGSTTFFHQFPRVWLCAGESPGEEINSTFWLSAYKQQQYPNFSTLLNMRHTLREQGYTTLLSDIVLL